MNSTTYGQTLQLLMIVELYIKPEKISCSWPSSRWAKYWSLESMIVHNPKPPKELMLRLYVVCILGQFFLKEISYNFEGMIKDAFSIVWNSKCFFWGRGGGKVRNFLPLRNLKKIQYKGFFWKKNPPKFA